MEKIGDDVMINSGLHQFQHGRIQAIETFTEIPFAHVLLRNKAGKLSKIGNGAYVPLKYCQAIDAETCAWAAAGRKEMMKKARRRRFEAEKAFEERMTNDSERA